jgi:sulfur carrier protein
MKIFLNGEERSLERALTVSELLESLALGGHRVAVEVNREIVPRSRHAELVLNENDRVEVVRAIGGGGSWQSRHRR